MRIEVEKFVLKIPEFGGAPPVSQMMEWGWLLVFLNTTVSPLFTVWLGGLKENPVGFDPSSMASTSLVPGPVPPPIPGMPATSSGQTSVAEGRGFATVPAVTTR